ncbi:MAG: hypothetical protein H0A76_02095 [Candidatus Thiodubiliella endoseptemdiera]|uniref:Uncharacterized protein n=1 Tax=Candidatus Thiodubiliella endoseptemdiera TaxID=2738886 RepID=A0A853F1H3_9GAMM|nr:hypothetical protein [Candidatus Thiodubiliella endoseptemdiera]
MVVGANDGTLNTIKIQALTSNPAYEAKTGDDNPFTALMWGIIPHQPWLILMAMVIQDLQWVRFMAPLKY